WVRIASGPAPDYNCNTVIGDLGTDGGMFKTALTGLPTGNYIANITIYASATSSNRFSRSLVLVYGPDGKSLMSGFGTVVKPFHQELTLDVPVAVDSSGVGLITTSRPTITARDGGVSTQTISIKVNSVVIRISN